MNIADLPGDGSTANGSAGSGGARTNKVLELPVTVAHRRDGQRAPEGGAVLGVGDVLNAGCLARLHRLVDPLHQR